MSLIRVDRRRGAVAALATAGALAAGGALSSPASAAFSTARCQGGEITGSGATTQDNPQKNFWTSSNPSSGALGAYCADAGAIPPVTYNTTGPNGSGYGRRVMGERSGDNADGSKSRSYGERFGASDDAPTQTQVGQMNQGTDAQGDEGRIHVVPVSVVAITVLVNLPDNCDLSAVPAGRFSDAGSADRKRLRLSGTEVEKVFAADADLDTWQELLPEATGAGCAAPIQRVVRKDDSGSTFVFKDYLNAYNPGRGWLSTYLSPDTTTWPGTPVRPANSGGGAVRDTVAATDGSIGYVELATSRGGSGKVFERSAGADDRYWIQVTNGAGQFLDPSSNADGFVADTPVGNKGARCSATAFRNVPADTFGDWSKTSGVNSNVDNAYGLCSLTYDLAFDDDAAAYGASAGEERKARSVLDYLSAIVSPGAQSATPGQGLLSQDQAPLPGNIQNIARAGVSQIGWNKAGAGSNAPSQQPSGTTPDNTTPGGGGGGGGGQGGPVPPAPVSNTITVPSARVKGKTIVLGVQVPGRGTLVALATTKYKGKTVRIGKVTANPTKSGAVKLTIKVSSKARKALRKAKRLRASIKLTFTPAGGSAASVTKTLTIKAKKAKKKSAKKSTGTA